LTAQFASRVVRKKFGELLPGEIIKELD